MYIQHIENKIGFNTYICVDMDTGLEYRRSRYQLQKTEIQFATCSDDEEFEDNTQDEVRQPIEHTETEVKQIAGEKKRFDIVSEEQLDDLALNRNSYRTRKQTVWAVKIL